MAMNSTEINNLYNALSILGWNSHFQQYFEKCSKGSAAPARVVGVHKNSFLIHQGEKEELATVSGKIIHDRENGYPVVGDWVLLNDTVISTVFPRRNVLSRGAAGAHGKQDLQPNKEQIIAANLDAVFIVSGTDRDFNTRRIERYLTLVYNCGLTPVIILTKADLHEDPELFVHQVEDVAFGVPVHLISANSSQELALLEPYISEGQTITMIGSSGAGKSTLLNRLYGKNVQTTNTVSESVGKGKHTTTNRSLVLMPQGGMVIDNPGIREISFWDDGDGLETTFPEISEFAMKCRFHDCSHTHEPGCHVLHGISVGEIRQDRLDSYQKMKRELAYLSDRQQKSADRIEKERWKDVSLKIKAIKKKKNGS